MTRVLVTGATGLIGRHTLPLLLERGFEVHAVHAASPPLPEPVEWHRTDLLDTGASAALVARVEPTHLLHLAWFAVPGAFWTSPENHRWVEASDALLRAFAAPGRRAIVAGTCAEYDWSGGGVCSESETPLRPATLYGRSKLRLWESTAALARETGASVAWARIFFVYGPHEHPDRVVASTARALLAGRPAPLSHGRQVRDFLHVRDVAGAFVRLLERPVEGSVNVGSGEPVSLRSLLGLVGRATGRPELLRFGEIHVSRDEPPEIVADVARLRDEVGFRPQYDLEGGIADAVAWWAER